MAESWVRDVAEMPEVVSRSVDVKTRMRKRPVEGKSRFISQLRMEVEGGRTILEISSNTIGVPLDFHIQQSPSRPQNAAQVICAVNNSFRA